VIHQEQESMGLFLFIKGEASLNYNHSEDVIQASSPIDQCKNHQLVFPQTQILS